ncbi:hypothetical protein SM764_04120 [Pseudophaeobacter sp. 1A16562]|uniref:hypothetical protein n=1 Tax=Pseudophaeobacter sp. 1A16562 TaxID=3098143 RepID=UPI0034D5D7A4
MQKLFVALREKYPEAEVRDVKFIVNPVEAADQAVTSIDIKLAEVVKNASPLAGAEALM